ncbi:MAG: hypothetical protein ACPHL6_12960, partial [Rubripirellula sp.]
LLPSRVILHRVLKANEFLLFQTTGQLTLDECEDARMQENRMTGMQVASELLCKINQDVHGMPARSFTSDLSTFTWAFEIVLVNPHVRKLVIVF